MLKMPILDQYSHDPKLISLAVMALKNHRFRSYLDKIRFKLEGKKVIR